MATVYWLHFQEHSDIFNNGYIGVTPNLKKRIREHKHKFKKIWNKIIVQSILIADNAYCYMIEKKLRPMRNIGWNIAAGGFRNNIMFGKENPNFGKHSESASAFQGFYITPKGKFTTTTEAASYFDTHPATINRKCKGRLLKNGKVLPPQKGWSFEPKGRVAS